MTSISTVYARVQTCQSKSTILRKKKYTGRKEQQSTSSRRVCTYMIFKDWFTKVLLSATS